MSKKLSNEQIGAINEERSQLETVSKKQTEEQRQFLYKHITTDTNLSEATRLALLAILEPVMLTNATTGEEEPFCEGFHLSLYRVGLTRAKEPHAQVALKIHDALIAYLERPANLLPSRLRGFLDGGVDITKASKDTAEDPMPKTGKSKTGVAAYDKKN